MEIGKLQPGLLLTVRDAAKLTNLSVPTFYTDQRKRDFGFDPKSKDQWLIPIELLVDHGLLNYDFTPTREPRTLLTKETSETLGKLERENRKLLTQVDELQRQIAVLEVRVAEKDKQLEMVSGLISRIGK